MTKPIDASRLEELRKVAVAADISDERVFTHCRTKGHVYRYLKIFGTPPTAIALLDTIAAKDAEIAMLHQHIQGAATAYTRELTKQGLKLNVISHSEGEA